TVPPPPLPRSPCRTLFPVLGFQPVLTLPEVHISPAIVLKRIEEGLGISHSFHTPYHPQSSGKVERVDRELKTALSKYCLETGLKWPQVLPIVLFHLSTRPTRVLGPSLPLNCFMGI
ncbi:hypothetical protein G0U57_000450, partial [Chelydra serpentina]